MKMTFAAFRRLAAALSVVLRPLALAAADTPAPPAEPPATAASATWPEADRAVVAKLLLPDASLPALASAASAQSPANTGAALERLSLLLRAGLFVEAAKAAAALPTLCPDGTAAQLWALQPQLTRPPYEAPEVAKALAAAYSALQAPAAPPVPAPPKELLIMTTDDENSRDYWLARARHWSGTTAYDRTVAAYERALEHTPPEASLSGPFDTRTLVLDEYTHYLTTQKNNAAVVRVFLEELSHAPGSVSAAHAAQTLVARFPAEVKPTNIAYMQWLAKRETWGPAERLVLAKLFENAMTDKLRLDEIETARQLALEPDASPTRAYELAWVVTRQNDAGLAVPLLESALQRAKDPDFRARTALALLQATVELRDWRAAEALLPQALPAMPAGDAAVWLGRLALGSARSGLPGQQTALRLWERAAYINLNYTDGLDELASHGLREHLRAFYTVMAKELPSSAAPPRALAVLDGRAGP